MWLVVRWRRNIAKRTVAQIPLTGFSGKWLNESKTNRRKAICRLLGVETLGLSKRPTELRFRYLDPGHDDFGTDRTERSAKIAMREPKPTPGLQSAERRLYERLCADKTIAYRRIEQERIPMRDAVDELRKLGIPVESIENQDLPI